MNNRYYVYYHIRKDTNEIFYVGKGVDGRAYAKNFRSKYWHNIVNLCGYVVVIHKKDITEKEAVELEKSLIAFYGRKDIKTGTLINMTNGGDGISGYKHSIESINKMKQNRQSTKGKKESEFTKLKKSIAAKKRGMDRRISLLSAEKSRKKISATSPNGNICTFIGIKNMATEFNINRGNIHACLIGKRKTTGGWSDFKYIL